MGKARVRNTKFKQPIESSRLEDKNSNWTDNIYISVHKVSSTHYMCSVWSEISLVVAGLFAESPSVELPVWCLNFLDKVTYFVKGRLVGIAA